MLDALILLRDLVESIEVQKACATCDHWKNNRCRLAEAVPPDDVQREGCESWEFMELPL